MAMGLSSNTSDYIWRMEAGREKGETEARRRAGNYLVNIAEMQGETPKDVLKRGRTGKTGDLRSG